MKVTTLDEKSIHDIGHAFGYYNYGEETGMSSAFSGKETLYFRWTCLCAGEISGARDEISREESSLREKNHRQG